MASILDMFGVPVKPVSPMKEMGVPGFSMVGGYIQTKERNPALMGEQKYLTASDILANVSIVSASLHYFLNLVASPNWKIEPVDESSEAKKAAEFVEECMYDMQVSWHKTIRRSGMFRFYGFGVYEWTAKRRDDGMTGFKTISARPQHTIHRWNLDKNGEVLGLWQQTDTGADVYLPRKKIIYLVDDTLSDSPEGFGLLRNIAEPAARYQEYLRIEGSGFERDFRGLPIGRAPLSALNEAVENGSIKKIDADKMLRGLTNFVTMQAKGKASGIVLDSRTYNGQTADGGISPSAQSQWGLEILTGSSNGIEHVGAAINRIAYDIAMIMGTEGMLTGRDGGSRALSEDKSRNLYLNVNSCVSDIAETFEKDFINPLWTLNGMDDKLKPSMKAEDVSFRTVEEITSAIRDMATAGAVLSPDDPIIQDVRDMLGVSRVPDDIMERTLAEGDEEGDEPIV